MLGEVISELHIRTPEYVPLFCLPIPGKHNPLIVVPIESTLVDVHVQVVSSPVARGLELVGLREEVLASLMASFYELLLEELGVAYGIRVTIRPGIAHKGFLYVAATNLIVRLLGGRFGDQELNALMAMDSKLGLGDCILGLRAYETLRRAYIWRYGEKAVGLTRDVRFYLVDILRSYKPGFTNVINDQELLNPLTRLSGLLLINIFRVLDGAGDTSQLRGYVRLFNSLWSGLLDGANNHIDAYCLSRYSDAILTHIVDLDRVVHACVRMGS